jgi:hypothetical protein
MMTAGTIVRSVLVASTLAVAVAGCSADPGSEASSGADQAYTTMYQHLPEATCTLIAGNGLAANHPLTMKWGGGYSGPDQHVIDFENAIHAAGGSGNYTISYNAAATSWFAIDVTHASSSLVTAAAVQYQSVSPVYSGYYSCDYDWGDYYIPPGGTRPYAPSLIAAFDPRGCGSACVPPTGTGI